MDPLEKAAQERVGQVLRGKWKLERVLGVGGMATVYAASHRNGMRGAVKILHPEVSRNADARQRFLREGYVANRLEKGGVKVLDDDTTEDGTVFLVMELLEGTTVDAMASARPHERLQPREVARIGLQLLDTLVLAHAAGIVHRDLKPENLFLTTSGDLRVLDFGIARLRDYAQGSVRATDTHSAMGTPAFMPPEQALARWDEVGPHSDIYSVGATMFTLLSGELTHVARSAPELLVAVATKPARPLREVLPNVSSGLAAVVDRALAHAPRDRWPDAASMRKELAFVARLLDTEDAPTDLDATVPFDAQRHVGASGSGTLVSSPTELAASPIQIPVVSAPARTPLETSTRAPYTATTAPVSSDPPTGRLGPKKEPSRAPWIVAGGAGVVALAVGAFVLHGLVVAPRLAASGGSSSAPLAPDPSSAAEPPRATQGASATPAPDVTPAPPPTASASAPASTTASPKKDRPPTTRPTATPTAAPTSKPNLDLSNPN